MPKKRSKFLTVIFSFLPGAGHMFMGFMKMGLSLMVPFFLIIFLSSWLELGPLMFIIPLLCFYSFFDAVNKCFASDEQFSQFKDKYLFSAGQLPKINALLFGKARLIAGILILITGLFIIINSLIDYFSPFISPTVMQLIGTTAQLLPRIIVSLVIISVGVYLIIGKKKGVDKDA
ncbi:MAG TPA: hypothetical protein VHO66_04685 [Ruminiclostridium sp.]|nr:hypothetical protein [Ruminiclostridium sp.]